MELRRNLIKSKTAGRVLSAISERNSIEESSCENFAHICGRVSSILNLIPEKSPLNSTDGHWDYQSSIVLSRSLYEMALAFFYLFYEDCDDKVRALRNIVFQYHGAHAKLFLSGKDDIQNKNIIQTHFEEKQKELMGNHIFNSFPDKFKKKILSGDKPIVQELRMIANNMGIPDESHVKLYSWLSSFSHGHPFSIYEDSTSNDFGSGNPSELQVESTTSVIRIVTSILNDCSLMHKAIFSKKIERYIGFFTENSILTRPDEDMSKLLFFIKEA